MHFQTNVQVFGQTVYLAGSRSLHQGELMIVATNQKPQSAISTYLRRWETESLFKALKTQGFYFQDTHLIKPDRMIFLLAAAFAWAHKIGEWQHTLKPIIFKQFKNSKRPQHSFFRYGLDFIRELLLNPISLNNSQLLKTIQIFVKKIKPNIKNKNSKQLKSPKYQLF